MTKPVEPDVDTCSDQLLIKDLQETIDIDNVFSTTCEWDFKMMQRSILSRGDHFDRKSIVSFELDNVEVLSVCMSDLPITIGRGEREDRRLDYEGISRRHCYLKRVGSLVRLCDARSKNGTLVNGEKVKVHDLREGDVIQLGAVCLRVRRM